MAGQHQGLEALSIELAEDGDGGGGHQGIAAAAAAAGLGAPAALAQEPVVEQGGPAGIQAAAQLPGIGVEVGLAAKAGQALANQDFVWAEEPRGRYSR